MAPKKAAKAKAKATTKAKASPKQSTPTKQTGKTSASPKSAPSKAVDPIVSDKKVSLPDSSGQETGGQSEPSASAPCDAAGESQTKALDAAESSCQKLSETPETEANDTREANALDQAGEADGKRNVEEKVDAPSTSADGDAPKAADHSEPQTKSVGELSKEERALRGLLQFVVCSDARRQPDGLDLKYREFILAYHSVVTPAADHRSDAPIVVDSAVGSTSVAQNKAGMSKEQLRAQLIAKQQTLEKELQGLRKKADLASQPITLIDDFDDANAIISEVHDAQETLASSVVDGVGTKRLATPNPPPPHTTSRGAATKRPAEFASSRAERESQLRRTFQDVLDAQVDEERIKAKKRAVEELRSGLKKELAVVKEERVKAMKLVAARQKEEAEALERLRQALASCDEHKLQVPMDDTESLS